MRVAKEISALSTSLPISSSSSVFLRVDSRRMDVIKALITGPEGTPYEHGCFIFDIFLPDNYPNSPPGCLIITTGNGTARFNPNLYACGKVCLSLLGTWSGPGWDPQHSTLLQVLVSIQSLILVPDPYFNEPGYERSMGTAEGTRNSAQYNRTIQFYTLSHAVCDHLTAPDPDFADVLTAHFRARRTNILEIMHKWSQSNPAISAALQQKVRSLLPA